MVEIEYSIAVWWCVSEVVALVVINKYNCYITGEHMIVENTNRDMSVDTLHCI